MATTLEMLPPAPTRTICGVNDLDETAAAGSPALLSDRGEKGEYLIKSSVYLHFFTEPSTWMLKQTAAQGQIWKGAVFTSAHPRIHQQSSSEHVESGPAEGECSTQAETAGQKDIDGDSSCQRGSINP